MMLTKGVELSGYFDVLAKRVIRHCSHERQLAMFLVSASALLATFLTNDVALFILVPLTLTLKQFCPIPASKLIIFEAFAVNVGSLLTPIGNPQNILLWGRSSLSFPAFIGQMMPLALLLMLSLWAMVFIGFRPRALNYQPSEQPARWQPKLVYSCLGLYLVFVLALEWHLTYWGVSLVALALFMQARSVFIRIDWSLLAVFIVMFIDVDMITRLPVLQGVLHTLPNLSPAGLYACGVILSQFISNVPATMLLLNSLPPSLILAFAVNIGGFGLAVGSMANIIALRMAGETDIWWRFHLYSLPLLGWAAAVGYGLILFLSR